MTRFALFIFIIVFGAGGAANADEPKALFAANDPIAFSLTGDWREIASSKPEDAPHKGMLAIDDEALPVKITTRGNSRRDKQVCTFPPLRIEFSEKPGKGSLFHKQKKLKLVTYCRTPESYQQYVLKEFAAYRLFNEMTPMSFRVRLADISYIDERSGKVKLVRKGFFIEDVDDVADRNDMKEVDRGRTAVENFNAADAAREALFQYMIANLDWEMTVGPPGENCCHNGRIIGAAKAAETNLTPVPYDFDVSGFVDAPYALPPDKLGVRNVRQRLYRGYCKFNAEAKAAAAEFLAKRAALEGALAATPGLADKTIAGSMKFLGGFFDIMGDDAGFEKSISGKCRG
ncbi:MAG: hypothetical protein R3C60_09825 [Parvularculaceae bacterium]